MQSAALAFLAGIAVASIGWSLVLRALLRVRTMVPRAREDSRTGGPPTQRPTAAQLEREREDLRQRQERDYRFGSDGTRGGSSDYHD